MLAFILAPLALLASALAAPVAEVHALKNFMLLSSPIKSTSTANTTGLNLVDPYHQTNFLLRAQEDAGSVFNLTTNGVLETMSDPPFVYTPARFKSNIDVTTGSVYFLEHQGTPGLFSFKKTFLAYAGDTNHWTLCAGELDIPVIFYNGTDASCSRVYIFHT